MGCNTSKETSTTANENESKDQKIKQDNQEESKDNHVGTGKLQPLIMKYSCVLVHVLSLRLIPR